MTIDFQALIDGMGMQWQKERADTQITLGKMIEILESMDNESEIDGISHPHSYRGYYCDLAFEKKDGKTKVSDALEMCKSSMGKVFEGYKGGDYVMGALTPVWIANYGSTGERIMEILQDGTIKTEPEDLED